jgi:hypothetical protein
VSIPLHAFVYDFTPFTECSGTDCKESGKLKENLSRSFPAPFLYAVIHSLSYREHSPFHIRKAIYVNCFVAW